MDKKLEELTDKIREILIEQDQAWEACRLATAVYEEVHKALPQYQACEAAEEKWREIGERKHALISLVDTRMKELFEQQNIAMGLPPKVNSATDLLKALNIGQTDYDVKPKYD